MQARTIDIEPARVHVIARDDGVLVPEDTYTVTNQYEWAAITRAVTDVERAVTRRVPAGACVAELAVHVDGSVEIVKINKINADDL